MIFRADTRPGRLLTPRAVGAFVAATGLVAGLTVIGTTAAASAAPPGPHDPYGRIGSVTSVPSVAGAPSTGITVKGWAVDPDARAANATVLGLVDGHVKVSVPTNVASATVAAREQSGPTPGFQLTVPVPAGPHTVCIGVANEGIGKSTLLRCVATPLGTTLTAAQLAQHSPQGLISSASATRTSLHVAGFATDPDYVRKHFQVVLYVDGQPVVTIGTGRTLAGAPVGSGPYASFDIVTPVSSGTHLACVWVVNVGFGSNSFLGCRALDTRAGQPLPVGSPPIATNAKVLAEATKHIGQRYVWGATGPKTFDCSGLVVYSYKKFGFVTPRVSEDQARAARLIPASRAVPGDLVFFHDTQGDVYHVAIYQSPGQTVAAIDPAEGVNYQRIWDPSTATYGSFTHT